MSEGWRRCRVCHAEKAASALDETGRCHGCATAAAATDAGMTYGKYTALRRSGLLPKQVALQARINRQRFAGIYCKNCGQRIPEGSEGFCCQECREKWEQQEKDSEERGIFLQPTKPEEKKPRFCRNCGKPVTGKKQYCDHRCKYIYNQAHIMLLQREYRKRKKEKAAGE